MTIPRWRLVAEFTPRGKPKGQPRGRATIRGRHAGIYDPGTADGWKSIVAFAGEPHRPSQPIEGPVSVAIDLLMPRPSRLMGKRHPDGEVWCTTKPDIDNAEKAILDALTNAGWWRDDAQVVELSSSKAYHSKTGIPGARISIYVPDTSVEVACSG